MQGVAAQGRTRKNMDHIQSQFCSGIQGSMQRTCQIWDTSIRGKRGNSRSCGQGYMNINGARHNHCSGKIFHFHHHQKEYIQLFNKNNCLSILPNHHPHKKLLAVTEAAAKLKNELATINRSNGHSGRGSAGLGDNKSNINQRRPLDPLIPGD